MANVAHPGRLARFLSKTVVAALVAVGLLAGAAGPALADCAALRAAAGPAQEHGDIARLMEIYQQVAVEPSCDDAFRSQFGRLIARMTEKTVYEAVVAGQSPAAFETQLVQSLHYARLWRVLAWLGDIERDRQHFTESTRYYQEALAVIQDEAETPKPPPPDVIETIFHSAEQTRLLASSYVAPPTTSAGAPTGLATTSVRGVTFTRVAVPIEFEYDSTTFTQKGREAANDLASQLRQKPPTGPIRLVGHTDPRGSEDYNQELSLRRAEAVRDFLYANDVRGDIQISGRGSREPPKIDEPESYSEEQRYQIARRVELQR